MDIRQQKILQAIIDSFIKSAMPVGSKHIRESYDFGVSPATIRNEMAALEEEGYIMQPHTSAGRVPTSMAYRMMVDQMKLQKQLIHRVQQDMLKVRREYYLKKTKEKLYDMVAILAGVTGNISFATLPDKNRVFYIGISNLLKKPEFITQPEKASKVIEILENELYDVLCDLDINDEGAVYIGEENILPEFQTCSLLAIPYLYKGFKGVMGILGSTRMDYPYNLAALRTAIQLLLD
jgi:transcriptional regulator of heat shock response